MKTALVLGRINGVGLDRDADLLASALRAHGLDVRIPRIKHPADVFGRDCADVAFHLERVAPWWWLRRARQHVLIPNQERYPLRLVRKLAGMDRIFCKSRHAEEIFRPYHPHVEYLGFTSMDRMLPFTQPDYSRFFHLAGRSTLKNTELLLKLWEKHREWPRLTLVQHPDNAPDKVPPNVDLVCRYLPDDELRALQNSHGIHLCPSLSEGWGHYIVEAMSCRALVVTTDAPPMNELVTPDRGCLVPSHHSEPRHLGHNYFADPMRLEDAIEQLIKLPEARKQTLGIAGRDWFAENQRAFSDRIAQLVL